MFDRILYRLRAKWRYRRMRIFVRNMNVSNGARILDLGGRPDLWAHVDEDVRITLLNRPNEIDAMAQHAGARFDLLSGDACNLQRLAASYDFVFSNSVLEHVGSARRQAQFAETIRHGRSYWVQVPAPAFPLEVHCRVPLWWLLPSRIRKRMIWKWYRGSARFKGRQMAGTRPIGRKRLRELFPDGQFLTERWFGLPKSYYVFRTKPVTNTVPISAYSGPPPGQGQSLWSKG